MKNLKKLIIITGPSGVGKGTVVKELLDRNKDIWLSISTTTRNPRIGEKAVSYTHLTLPTKRIV